MMKTEKKTATTPQKNAFTIVESIIVITFFASIISAIYFVNKINQVNDIKSLIMQIKKYDIAINAFTQKYHALPGDVENTVDYGITDSNTDGDNNNIITDSAQKNFSANGEISNLWMHLSKTKMLDENYDGAEDDKAKIGTTFPISKIGDKIGILAYGANGKTFYQIGFDFADYDRLYASDKSLKTTEAYLFDKKIDDANPKTGRVIAVSGKMLNLLAPDMIKNNNTCIKFAEYNFSVPFPACQLRIEIK